MSIELGPQISCARAQINGAVWLHQRVFEPDIWEPSDEVEIAATQHFLACADSLCKEGRELIEEYVTGNWARSDQRKMELTTAIVRWQGKISQATQLKK